MKMSHHNNAKSATAINNKWEDFFDDENPIEEIKKDNKPSTNVSVFNEQEPKVVDTVGVNSVRYLKGNVIGQGTFGVVYRAFDNQKLRAVAIKELKNKEHKKNEYDTIKRINHENIIKYYDCIEINGVTSIIMEHCSGGSLRSYLNNLDEDVFLSEDVVKDILIQALRGLSVLHNKGYIIHRDIKSDNLLLVPDARRKCGFTVKLADFGSCKKFKKTERPHPYTKGSFGTINTMAPEIMKGEEYTYNADIYSLGCVALELFEKTETWYGYNAGQIVFQLCLEGNAPCIPEYVCNKAKLFLLKCLTLNPSERYNANDALADPYLSASEFPEFHYKILKR